MTDLAAWLLEQIAEDERHASVMAAEYPTPWDMADRGRIARVVADGPHFHEVIRVEQDQVSKDVGWLGECAAKRQVVELHGDQHDCADPSSGVYPYVGCRTLRLLALPYADRPGYREEWRP